MPGPTTSTGSVMILGKNTESRTLDKARRPVQEPDELHVAVLANFSGNGRSLKRGEAINTRRLTEVDRDNIEDVFARLHVSLKLPFSDVPLEFSQLDDLEPDFIYQHVPLFAKFRELKQELQNSEKFEAVAKEISMWPDFSLPNDDAEVAATCPLAIGGAEEASLEDILAFTEDQYSLQSTENSRVDALIKSIVRPYAESHADPRQQPMLAAVDRASNDLMRKIMHQSGFQQLEASWRSLYKLLRNCESGADLKIFLVDVGVDEVSSDFAEAATPEDSGLYQLLVASRQHAGDTPLGLIVADYRLGDNERDAMAALALGSIALAVNAACLAGAHEQLIGCPSLAVTPDPDEWPMEFLMPEYWQAIRHTEAASHLGLVAPRVLLRLPYGESGQSTDVFPFEELPTPGDQRSYLWGNGAFVVALLLVKSYAKYSWEFKPGILQEVQDLPIHTYKLDGEDKVTPSGEIYLSDAGSKRMVAAGLIPLLSVRNKDSVIVPSYRSFAADGCVLRGPWQRD